MDVTFPDVSVLTDILNSIETRTPSLVVKELDVRIRDFKNPKELMVKLDVSAITGGKPLPPPAQGGKALPSPAPAGPATPKQTADE
jgi:hypothetical protein